jgi:hypothetical protein
MKLLSNYKFEPSVKHQGPRLSAAQRFVAAGSTRRYASREFRGYLERRA